ncbi:hypothetical protein ACFX5K_01300 [Rickettsiales bacterium LUAb2]
MGNKAMNTIETIILIIGGICAIFSSICGGILWIVKRDFVTRSLFFKEISRIENDNNNELEKIKKDFTDTINSIKDSLHKQQCDMVEIKTTQRNAINLLEEVREIVSKKHTRSGK